jgi:hypothetical protein
MQKELLESMLCTNQSQNERVLREGTRIFEYLQMIEFGFPYIHNNLEWSHRSHRKYHKQYKRHLINRSKKGNLHK